MIPTFLGLEHVSLLHCCLWEGQKALRFHHINILICVPKMNEGLTGLERHEGEYLMTELSFFCELSLILISVSDYSMTQIP